MKFLIISSYYPPWKTVGSLRAGMMANELIRSDHECAVLTLGLDVLPKRDDNFLSLNRRIIEKRVSPKLIIPYQLHLPSGKNPGFFYKLIRKLSTYWTPDVYYYWALSASKQYIHHPSLIPDVVISSALPFSVHHAGQIIAKEYNAFWVADFRDLWVDNPYLPMVEKRRNRSSDHQKKLLSKASLVLGISEEMVNILRKSLPDKVPSAVLMNAFATESNPRIIHEKHNNPDCFFFVYTGRLYEGYRDMESLFRALSSMLKNNGCFEDIQIRFSYAGPDGNILIRQAAKYNLQHIIEDKGYISRGEALALQRKADVLLLSIGNGSKNDAMVITGKVFEYLSSKKPILALGYPDGAVARLFKDTGAGYIFSPDDVPGIKNVIHRWLSDFGKSGSISWDIPDEKIIKHSWSYRIKELLTMIEELKK